MSTSYALSRLLTSTVATNVSCQQKNDETCQAKGGVPSKREQAEPREQRLPSACLN